MSETLQPPRPAVPAMAPPPRRRSIGLWRVALRLAVRDLTRHRGRALLMVLLVALPVASVAGVATVFEAQLRGNEPVAVALRSLGDADASVAATQWQSPVAQNLLGTDAIPVADERERRAGWSDAAMRELVPADWTLHRIDWVQGSVDGDSQGTGPIAVANTDDPVIAGRFELFDGRLATGPDEITLNAQTKAALGIGDHVTITRWAGDTTEKSQLRVVGTIRPAPLPSWAAEPLGVVAPPVWPDVSAAEPQLVTRWDDTATRWLVTTPAGAVTWDEVTGLNAQGAVTTSRAVLEQPPAGCEPLSVCGPAGQAASVDEYQEFMATSVEESAVIGGMVAIGIALAVVQVALLAGPAFAVSLRGRQRDLALLAANGATTRDLRRQMLASGVAVGLAGAALGAVVGYGLAWVAYNMPIVGMDAAPAVPPVWWTVLLPAIFAVVCAVAAAWIPARLTGRTNVVAALAGRPPDTAAPRRAPIAGLLALATGVVLFSWGSVHENDSSGAFALFASVLIAELGLVACIPAIVSGLARIGGRLSVATRMALRDLSRHRVRTAAAIAAVCASSLVAATMLTAIASTEAPLSPIKDGTFATAPASVLVTANQTRIDQLTADVRAAAPDATILTPPSLVAAESGRPLGVMSPWSQLPLVVMSGPELESLIASPSATADLAAGRMVTFAGDTGVTEADLGIEARQYSRRLVPAVAVPGDYVPAAAVVGPDFDAVTIGARFGAPASLYVITEGLPAEQTAALRQELRGEQRFVSRPLDDSSQYVARAEYRDWFLLGLAVSLGIVVLTALMVTGLALMDGRRDLGTATRVGAPPAFRRRFAAAAAGIVTSVGAVLGVGSMVTALLILAAARGFQSVGVQTPAGITWVMGNPLTDYAPWVIPVGWLLGIVIVPALLVAAVAAAATRSDSRSG